MKDFYDDEKKIAGHVHHMAALVFFGARVGKEVRYHVERFSGIRTLGRFRLKEDKSQTFKVSLHLTEGKAKLVLVNKSGIKTLCENACEGEKKVFLPEGVTRIRLVGFHACFILSLERLP